MNQTVTLDLANAKVNIPLQSLLEQIGSNIQATITIGASAPKAPKIGEPWPGQGGIYAGVMRGHAGKPDYHLILAVDPSAKFEEMEWGEHGSLLEGASDEWDGHANTHAIMQHEGDFPAAEAAINTFVDGHRDFYLPSKRESALLYANLPEHFEKVWHWTSTQVSASYAAIQDFSDGGQLSYGEDVELRVRVVRRLTI